MILHLLFTPKRAPADNVVSWAFDGNRCRRRTRTVSTYPLGMRPGLAGRHQPHNWWFWDDSKRNNIKFTSDSKKGWSSPPLSYGVRYMEDAWYLDTLVKPTNCKWFSFACIPYYVCWGINARPLDWNLNSWFLCRSLARNPKRLSNFMVQKSMWCHV